VIGEVKGQGAYIASRCLWDTETDNYSSFSMKNVSRTDNRPPSLPLCRRYLACDVALLDHCNAPRSDSAWRVAFAAVPAVSVQSSLFCVLMVFGLYLE